MADLELRTWKQICHAVGRCERICRELAVRSFDPLPVWDDGFGTPCAFEGALREWKARQRRPWSHKHRDDAVRQSGPPSTEPLD
jgi:hypothetical protein